MTQQPRWQEYQNDVATFFSRLGFIAKTDEKIQGARGSHNIDVTARMTMAGISQLWLAECKKWRRPVPKERVLTFAGIISDTGADRGLMFSESGFQAGAVRAAANTNITLTSLADFQENAKDELVALRAKKLEEKAVALEQKSLAIWDLDEVEHHKVLERYVGPPDMIGRVVPTIISASLTQMRDLLDAARLRRWTSLYWILPGEDEHLLSVAHWDELLFFVEETLSKCELVYAHITSVGDRVAHWEEVQFPRLGELIDLVRSRCPQCQ